MEMRGSNSNQTVDQNRVREEPPTSSITPSPPRLQLPPPQPVIRYRECLKNHAASMGGHVTDGCGEFMPSGEEGTADSLKCAACECHRSFHRREDGGDLEPPSGSVPVPYYQYNIHMSNSNLAQRGTVSRIVVPPPPPPRLLAPQHRQDRTAMPPVMMAFGGGAAAESSSEDLNLIHGGVGGQSTSKKRFRTKFTLEQKRKMEEFAERIEWKIPKQNESEVQQFCAEVGVNRQVFKVWMHNCKQASKKKQL